MVDVDRAAGEIAHERVGQHLHVAREHDELGAGLVDQRRAASLPASALVAAVTGR